MAVLQYPSYEQNAMIPHMVSGRMRQKAFFLSTKESILLEV